MIGYISREIVLNNLSKKTLNVHNDKINDMIPSLWTFRIFLDKSFTIGFSTRAVVHLKLNTKVSASYSFLDFV